MNQVRISTSADRGRLAEASFDHDHKPLPKRENMFARHGYQWPREGEQCQPVNGRPGEKLSPFAITLAEKPSFLHPIQSERKQLVWVES